MRLLKFVLCGSFGGLAISLLLGILFNTGARNELVFELTVYMVVGTISGLFLGIIAEGVTRRAKTLTVADEIKLPNTSDLTAITPRSRSRLNRKAGIVSGVISLLIYAVLVGIHFDPKARAVSAEAFGNAPMGIPVTAVVIACGTVMYTPMIFVWYHLVLLLTRAQEEGVSNPRGGFSFLAFLMEAEKRYPELKLSVYVCVGGVFYCAAIIAFWAWFANHRGI